MGAGNRASRPQEIKSYRRGAWIAAVLVLLAGFADLVRGGTVVAPVLLVLAYLLLVPLAIHGRWTVAPARDAAAHPSPSWLAAANVSVAVFLLYLLTLAPSTAMWDTSEYIAAAYTLGLPHPPGNPLFVLLGRFFALLPIAPNVAMRINILAALCGAASAGLWFLVTERVLVSWFTQRWQRILGGTLAAVIGATAFTDWNQSVVNEKVYTIALLGIAIISWLMIRWSDDPDGPKADRLLVMVAYLSGLGYANHMAGFLAAPAAALAILVRRPRTYMRWRLVLACMGALVLGMTPFATQPIRAAYFPPINEGEPTACRTHIGWDCTFSKGTVDAFMYNFNRGQYGKPALSERQACPPGTQPPCSVAESYPAQVQMWWTYFKWQWLRDAHNHHAALQSLLGAVFLVLGLFGAYVHWERDRRSFWYFGAYMLTVTLILIFYLNFKYGASQAPELGDTVAREVRDRDYFFIWSFSPWGVWAGLGLLYVWEAIATLFGSREAKVGKRVERVPQRAALLAASPLLLLAGIPLVTNWHTASRHGQTDTADFAKDLLNSVEPYGVLITVGDNDTFPLWYAQEVEGVRKDVVVANTSLLNTDWYTRQLIRRPIYTYDAATGPALYRNRVWPKPTTPPLKMTLNQADSVAEAFQMTQPMEFKAGCGAAGAPGAAAAAPKPGAPTAAGAAPACAITATIQPHVLVRADLFVLRMIEDSWGQRPIYFSRTSGGYPHELGLQNYVLTQGLASKVFVPPATSDKDTLYVQGDGWVDVPRTLALWQSVFQGPRALIDRGDWVDTPSLGIPYLYVASGLELADVLRAEERTRAAGQMESVATRVADAVRLGQLIQPPQVVPTSAPLLGDTVSGSTLPAKGRP